MIGLMIGLLLVGVLGYWIYTRKAVMLPSNATAAITSNINDQRAALATAAIANTALATTDTSYQIHLAQSVEATHIEAAINLKDPTYIAAQAKKGLYYDPNTNSFLPQFF